MGSIAGVLFTAPACRYLVSDASSHLTIPFWMVLMAHAAIAAGTLFGGWRIVHTVGSRITKLQPPSVDLPPSRPSDYHLRFFDPEHPCLYYSGHHRGDRQCRFGA
jgi:hypothetical protein